MLSRILGIAALALAATISTAATTVPAHADDDYVSFLQEVKMPLCRPEPGTGIPFLDALLTQLVACAR